jgi:hypothetical protein
LGEISLFWAIFSAFGLIFALGLILLPLGAFVSEKYRPNHLGDIFFYKIVQNLPK